MQIHFSFLLFPSSVLNYNLRSQVHQPDSFLGPEARGKEELGNQLNANHSERLNVSLSMNKNDNETNSRLKSNNHNQNLEVLLVNTIVLSSEGRDGLGRQTVGVALRTTFKFLTIVK